MLRRKDSWTVKGQGRKKADGKQCEKKGKIDQAATKLNEGAKFDDVAREFSEDKAKSGTSPYVNMM